MKPYVHACSSSRKYGGTPEDYLEIHDWFDQTKSHFGDNRHRAILHTSFGIFLAEQVFGHNITNSANKSVSVRDIGEQHVMEDMKFIPTISDYLSEMDYKNWMHGKGVPASYKKIQDKTSTKKDKVFIPFVAEEEKPEPKVKYPSKPMMIDGSRLPPFDTLSSPPKGDKFLQFPDKPVIPNYDVVYDGSGYTREGLLGNKIEEEVDDGYTIVDYEPQMVVD